MTAYSTGELPTYRIRVRGVLGRECSDRLGGMEVTVWEDAGGTPFAELTGQLTDEAALMGVLEHLYTLRLPVDGVERVGIRRTEEASVTTQRTGDCTR